MSEQAGTVVIKVGGSVLRTPPDIVSVTERISRLDQPPVVVVSALNGTTDSLFAVIEEAEDGTASLDSFIKDIRSRHQQMLSSGVSRSIDMAPIDAVLEDLRERLQTIQHRGETTPRARDAICAIGERLAARVIAMSLQESGSAAVSIDADELGVITDGIFGRATVRLAETTDRIREPLLDHLAEGTIPVITGYFGRSNHGDITTFGRGGSDYSAAIISNSLDATRLEIWKDVEGFLTADPARISSAKVVPFMTYDEAAELAYLGVQVLHPRTLEPVRKRQIPVVVRGAHTETPGTKIGPPREEPDQLRAIGTREGFGIVRMHGSAMAYEPGVGAKVFQTLSEHDINIVNMAASQATFALLVNGQDTDRAAAILEQTGIPTVEAISGDRGYSLICIVGRNIGLREGVAGRVFSVVGEAGVNVDMISVGSSNVAMSFVVDESDLPTAMQALHMALFEHASHEDDPVERSSVTGS